MRIHATVEEILSKMSYASKKLCAQCERALTSEFKRCAATVTNIADLNLLEKTTIGNHRRVEQVTIILRDETVEAGG